MGLVAHEATKGSRGVLAVVDELALGTKVLYKTGSSPIR
jgi:hypothetical protein